MGRSNTAGTASAERFARPVTLRELRHQADLSLRALADMAHLSPAVVSQIENGRLHATETELQKLSFALGLPAGALVTRTLVVCA